MEDGVKRGWAKALGLDDDRSNSGHYGTQPGYWSTDPKDVALVAAANAARRVTAVAQEFSRLVRRDLAEHLPEIVARNAKYGDGFCATHDFCDANEIMAEAFQKIAGREVDIQSQDDVDVWNAAWSEAKAAKFQNHKWQAAFPDYAVEDMPAIPASWVDASWAADACPSFIFMGDVNDKSVDGAHTFARVWVGYSDPEYRTSEFDFTVNCRFFITFEGGTGGNGCEDVMETDEWASILHWVNVHVLVADHAVAQGGVNPFMANPRRPVEV